MHDSLWQPIKVGNLDLEHRIVMAPMTRNRSTAEGVPNALNVEYYAQRAAATALIVTEGTQPSDDGQGYLLTPGIYTPAQVAGWRRVTDAVHEAGGNIFIQLMHVGRMGHPVNTPHGRTPVAPSAVRAAGTIVTYDGPLELPVPRALGTSEVGKVVDEFRRAAAAAVQAGADGVEIHGANGYLVHQFLARNTNLRTDQYGGSDENKARFALEVASAVAGEIGPERTGIRLAPGNPFNDIQETDAEALRSLYLHLVERLADLDLAYLHLVRPADDDLVKAIRAAWPNPLIVNHARQPLEPRIADLENGLADVLSLGALHIANPDLAVRLKGGHELNQPDPTTFYGGDAHGYTDYPVLGS